VPIEHLDKRTGRDEKARPAGWNNRLPRSVVMRCECRLSTLLRRHCWCWRMTGMVMNGTLDGPFVWDPPARRHSSDLASLLNSVCMLTRTVSMFAISEENG